MMLPIVMEYSAACTGEKYREIARAMGVANVDAMSQEEYRQAAVEAVRKLSADVGIPSKPPVLKEEDLPFPAESAYADACRPGHPKDTNVEELLSLIHIFPERPLDTVPTDLDAQNAEWFRFYAMKRGHHERARGGFTTTSNIPFLNYNLLSHLDEISPRPILFLVGDRAHSKSFSETVYAQAKEPKELYVVRDAEHIDQMCIRDRPGNTANAPKNKKQKNRFWLRHVLVYILTLCCSNAEEMVKPLAKEPIKNPWKSVKAAQRYFCLHPLQ